MIENNSNSNLSIDISRLEEIVRSNELLTKIVDVWASEDSPYVELYKVIVDGKAVVSKSKMITAITVGMELGLSPQLALTMGNRLTPETVFSVIKGKELGLPLTHAMQNIVTYTNKDGKITNIIDIHAVRTVLIKNKIIEEVVEDMVPVYEYFSTEGSLIPFDMISKNGKIHEHIFIFDPYVNPTDLNNAVSNNRVIVERRFNGNYRTTVKLTREDRSVTYSYTVEEALRSGFIGNDKKDVYEKHIRKMLHKQALHGAANIIAGDLIQGGYTKEQALSFIEEPNTIRNIKKLDSDETEFEDITK